MNYFGAIVMGVTLVIVLGFVVFREGTGRGMNPGIKHGETAPKPTGPPIKAPEVAEVTYLEDYNTRRYLEAVTWAGDHYLN